MIPSGATGRGGGTGGSDDGGDLHPRLRAWARGLFPLEAATELLIRAGFARAQDPWVRREPSDANPSDAVWIDFAAVSAFVEPMSAGERRVLLFAASLSGVDDAPAIRLGEMMSVEPRRLALLVAALAHAGGRRDVWWTAPAAPS
ncbi:hypothetical protein [Cellulomonas sp. Marseille-Q8402]